MRKAPKRPGKVPLVWRLMRLANSRAVRAFEAGRGRSMGLVLTTTGRTTGKPHRTPLQYEEIAGVLYVGSARGKQADWYRNLVACPFVVVQMGDEVFAARAEPLDQPAQVHAFLRERMRRHPWMIRLMLPMHGIPPWAGDRALGRLAERLAIVALRDRQGVAPRAPLDSDGGAQHA